MCGCGEARPGIRVTGVPVCSVGAHRPCPASIRGRWCGEQPQQFSGRAGTPGGLFREPAVSVREVRLRPGRQHHADHAFSGCFVHMAEHRGDADERFARVRARLGPSGRPATDGVRFPPEALGHDAAASAPGLNDEFHVRGAVPVVHGLFEQFVRRRLFPQPCRGAQMPPRLSPALAAQRGPDVAQIGQSGRELPWLPEARRRRPAGRRAAARRKTWACCCGDTTGRRKAPRG